MLANTRIFMFAVPWTIFWCALIGWGWGWGWEWEWA